MQFTETQVLRDLLRLTGRFYDLLHRKPGFVKTHSPLGRAGYNQHGGEGISGQAQALFFYIIQAGEQAVRQVLKDGYRTGDIMSDGCEKVGTTRMGDLVAERIR